MMNKDKPSKMRSLSNAPLTRSALSYEEEKPKQFNPDPMPFQSSGFKSSTMIKKVPMSRRNQDMWGGGSAPDMFPKTKGFILHTDRYQWNEFQKTPGDGLGPNQRDRMAIEQEYMERMKVYKRRREIIQHREPIDLLLGGEKCSYTERMDITGEINRLKTVLLPKKAKDLYVGRGFKLPESHSLNHPRTIAPRGNKYRQSDYENPHNPKGEDGGKWSKNGGDAEPGDSIIDSIDILRAESEMDIKFTEDPPADQTKTESDANPNPPPPTKSASPTKTFTPNPLKATNMIVDEDTLDLLRATFKRLDTDADGHVMFNQFKSQLPQGLTTAQERYIKLVYDITSSSTFFGVDEFVSMTQFCQIVADLSGPAKDALQNAEFASFDEAVKQYLERFTSVDRQETGKISPDSLKGILAAATGSDLAEEQFNIVQDVLHLNGTAEDFIAKLQYLAHIPYFISLENK